MYVWKFCDLKNYDIIIALHKFVNFLYLVSKFVIR